MEEKIGYKAMNEDMTCRGFKYEIGKTYEAVGKIEICENGFHFCKNIFDTFRYYPNLNGDKRFFKIQYDKFINNDDKSITNKITILEEVNIFDFINDSMSKSDWCYLSLYQKLYESFIREFKDKIDWEYISSSQTLSEEFIREFQNYVYWSYVSCYQKLSESFIREFQNKVDWTYISKYQTLSEDFIREFQTEVNLNLISKSQTLSKQFIKEFNYKLK